MPPGPVVLTSTTRVDSRSCSRGIILPFSTGSRVEVGFHIEVQRICDKGSDLVAARAVGARAVLVLTGYGLGEWEYRRSVLPVQPDHVADDLFGAADWAIEGLSR